MFDKKLLAIIQYLFIIFTGLKKSDPTNIKEYKEYLVYCIRAITRNMNYLQRFKLIEEASVMKNGEIGNNVFALGLETVMAALGESDIMVSERICPWGYEDFDNDINTVNVTNGEIGSGFFTDKRINGKYAISEDKHGNPVLAPNARCVLLSQDQHYNRFVLRVMSRAETKLAVKPNVDSTIADKLQQTEGVVPSINFIADKIDEGCRFYYNVRPKPLNDVIEYIGSDGVRRVLTKVVYSIPTNGQNPLAGNNPLADKLKGKELKLDFYTTYISKRGDEEFEHIVLLGKFK